MKRKTIKVDLIKEKVNVLLAEKENSVEFKRGLICMIEFTLHQTDSYNGFYFLNPGENPQWDTQEHASRKYF